MRPAPTLVLRRSLLLAGTLCLAACGGGGGGGSSNPAPLSITLVAAVFEGSSPSDRVPDPGETLRLYFSGDITLVGGALLDGMDLDTGGDSLGTVRNAPALLDSRSLGIVLGSGVSFTPGSSTLAIRAGQDAIVDLKGNLLPPGLPVTIRLSDGNRPSISSLTLAGVPAELNGTGTAGGTLQAAPSGFTIDAAYTDASSALDATAFLLDCDVQVVAGGQARPPGTNLLPFLSGSPGANAAHWTVPSTLVFPEGDAVLTLTVADLSGERSPPLSFAFRVKKPTDALRPFEDGPPGGQVWYLDLSRDLEALSSSTSDGGVTITLSVAIGANGLPDFEEELRILGLHSPSPIANVSGGKDSNEVVMDLLRSEWLTWLGTFYRNTKVVYTFTDPGGFPAGQSRVPYASGTHSRLAVAGSSDLGALGLAFFDPNNGSQDDDTLHPSSNPPSTNRLGVFLHTLTAFSINLTGSLFRQTFDEFLDHRGTPIGEDAADKTRLQNLLSSTSGDTRQGRIETAIARLGRFLAVVTAHESGHSMGLVQNGAQPTGLYGNLPAVFPGSTDGHIDLSSTTIFPATAQEIMSPGLSFTKSLNPSTDFNPLLRAYLQEKVFYGN